MRGKFLVFEGMDGCGKTTQAQLLVAWLESKGRSPLHIREPGTTPAGERFRNLLLDPTREPWDPATEALLFFASRRELLLQEIQPALEAGKDVICERFTPSTLAYQGTSPELAEFVLALDQIVVPEELQPDHVLILDLEPEEALRRATSRSEADSFESRGLSFQVQVQKGYHRYAKERPQNTSLLAVSRCDPEEVALLIKTAVEVLFA
ncbi:MAG: dTMP kinase [Planctomycetes bacterium]|jgi:dTMP kinase|nr:dTMP kinase [Planctomycetota bacterium]MDP6128774.1 dTMP kinase [Planctomycetota bacterium]MDP7246529.1 dTMP kinase [Planctomycetota bacterium]|tara:strand:- start:13953 stop:14576 length:624 start_codon:yes stop_codon:yes gene_type:complete